MSKRIKSLLFEAYRRNEMADSHERSKPLNRRWLGLGTAAAYRPAIDAGLMTFFDGVTPPPRCMGWLVLTDAGIVAMMQSEAEFSEIMRRLRDETNYPRSIAANYTLAGGITR